jgi:hypothetical protein
VKLADMWQTCRDGEVDLAAGDHSQQILADLNLRIRGFLDWEPGTDAISNGLARLMLMIQLVGTEKCWWQK